MFVCAFFFKFFDYASPPLRQAFTDIFEGLLVSDLKKYLFQIAAKKFFKQSHSIGFGTRFQKGMILGYQKKILKYFF